MYPLFHTATIGGDNLTLHSDPEFDKLIDEARTETDDAERNSKYNEAEKRILDNVVIIPLNWYRGTIVWKPSVKNVQETPLGFLNYESMWLENS
jgi:peptide/nickel transport system substrate-binding protein/oligopeptide transport system substrate-binding protein